MVHGSLSDWAFVLRGVPQGSVLGPLLFLLYVDDLSDCIKCNIRLFADGANIWHVIKMVEDNKMLQGDLDNLAIWTQEWMLEFNPEKCRVLLATIQIQST